MPNINMKSLLTALPNSNSKKKALALLNAGNIQGLFDLAQLPEHKPNLHVVTSVLEGRDFSGNLSNVPRYMRPTPNILGNSGGKRSRRTRHTLRKKRTLRKTRRHTRRA